MNFKKMFGLSRRTPSGRFVGRAKTRDVAFLYRMGAGSPGDVNRTHPASIEPCLMDTTNPPALFGVPVVVNPTSQGVRGVLVADFGATTVYGIAVRSYPIQQSSATNFGAIPFGTGAPAAGQPLDVLRSGYIMVQLPAGAPTPKKGGAVFIWAAATTGVHVLGGFESVTSAGNTIALDPSRTTFNGSPDANGVVEIVFNN